MKWVIKEKIPCKFSTLPFNVFTFDDFFQDFTDTIHGHGCIVIDRYDC